MYSLIINNGQNTIYLIKCPQKGISKKLFIPRTYFFSISFIHIKHINIIHIVRWLNLDNYYNFEQNFFSKIMLNQYWKKRKHNITSSNILITTK